MAVMTRDLAECGFAESRGLAQDWLRGRLATLAVYADQAESYISVRLIGSNVFYGGAPINPRAAIPLGIPGAISPLKDTCHF